MMREKCGVIGAYSFNDFDVSQLLVRGLESLQHRGQESWGIAVFGHDAYKKLGLVMEDPDDAYNVEKMKGSVGIGHVRYSTKGRTAIENAHPIKIGKSLFIAHNGTIANVDELANKVSKENSISGSVTDTELVGIRLKQIYNQYKDWQTSFEILSKELNGSYSMVILTEKGELLAARDERGFRPLCIGYQEDTKTYLIASESCSLDSLEAKLMKDVKPGELVKIDESGLSTYMFFNEVRHAHCPFEYTYFSHPSSYLEGINVYFARKRIGAELAKKYQLEGDVVIPVPDSARPAARGFSEESKIPFEEGLMKDRYRKRGSFRSFIEPIQKRREEIVKKIRAVKAIVDEKNVIVVDDSIVRGTSSLIITDILKKAGAKKISFVITFPPIRYPCYAGIDFPTQEELIAYKFCKDKSDLNYINDMVTFALNADFVGYNDIEGLSKGIGLPVNELCLSCVTGDYSCLKYTPKFKSREEMKG
ncbi:MAG: amidophosphoribosyltransferase [archaeon]|nr:amidophosphoribosyltransferase [archaeon]MCP8314258.1 amidophosphoribosyltransferase [archaeon]MCP8316630.1 amidophosphoribosyltransferase [archaeon]MCP8320945.1 amidophosphoribosyltransferase [archaeon]